MSEKSAPYLHLVRHPSPADQVDESDVGPGQREELTPSESSASTGVSSSASSGASSGTLSSAAEQERIPLNAPLQQAIMYAAVSWVALVMERTAHSVDIQPVGRNLYEVSVHYADDEGHDTGEGVILRVAMAIDPGLIMRTTVEPVKP